MELLLLKAGDFTENTYNVLREQGVDLDDWDYMLLAPVETIIEAEEQESYTGEKRSYWEQQDYLLDRLLTGCCSNKWYKVTLDGEEYALGVAYHA